MNKPELIEQLNAQHRHLLGLVQDFSKADFEQTPAMSGWTIKDIFAHIAYWNWEAMKAVEQFARGERPVMMLDVNFDEINQRETAARREQPLHKVMQDFHRSHRSLAALIASESEHELTKTTPFKSGDDKDANAAWIVGGIIEHYQEHLQPLEEFLSRSTSKNS